jgi:(heptosyl)LPS beta-1,4-glucosyltransferase
MARAPVTVTIVAQDEQARIADAIRSVSWAEEVLVLDGGSRDDTVAVARGLGARVERHAWDGYASQKQRSVGLATHDWILGLDADETVSPQLAASAQAALAAPGDDVAFACNRRNHYLGQPIRWCGWYPDRRVRLFHRDHGAWVGPDPHDTVQARGPVGFLDGDLEHRSYRDVQDHLRSIRRLADVWAESMHGLGRRARPWDTTLRPAAHFLKNYLLRLGVLEGRRGVLICALGAWHVARRYRALRRRWRELPP